jgi:hypothetical protein
MTKNNIFLEMKKTWGSAIVARKEVGKFSGGILNPRYMSNLDSRGDGPAGKITIGRRVAYSVDSLIEWMQKRAS